MTIKSSVRITGVPAENPSEDLPNKGQERNCYDNPKSKNHMDEGIPSCSIKLLFTAPMLLAVCRRIYIVSYILRVIKLFRDLNSLISLPWTYCLIHKVMEK
jgi:hypothetical protein